MNIKKITFDNSKATKEFLLKAFNKKIDSEGFVTNDKGQRIVAQNGEEINISEFAGIKKGSEVFIKNDLLSLIKISDICQVPIL